MSKITLQELKEKTEQQMLNNMVKKPTINYESNCGVRITKSAGYIPLNRQIEILQDAGKRMELMREGIYDYQDENFSFDATDPTRRLNFDLAEASELKRQTDTEIKKIQRQNYLNRVARHAELHRQTLEEQNKGIDTMVSIGDNTNKDKLSPDKKEVIK